MNRYDKEYMTKLERNVNTLQSTNDWLTSRIAEYQVQVESLKAEVEKWKENYFKILDELQRR